MELISNIPNEILFVGAIYKHPDYLVEYGHYVKSKYDFADEATKFFLRRSVNYLRNSDARIQ